MSKYVSGVIIGLLVFVTVRVIAGAFGLDEKALKLGYWLPLIPKEHLPLITWALSASVSLIVLILWLTLNVDARIRNWWIAAPPIGSLRPALQPTMKVEITGKLGGDPNNRRVRQVELSVPLRNATGRLLKFDADLRATVNGKDLDKPAAFSGYVGANEITHLLVTVRDVPMMMEDGAMHVLGRMRYDVHYHFDGEAGSRRTSKLVQWEGKAPPSGEPYSERRLDIFVRYFDEIEE